MPACTGQRTGRCRKTKYDVVALGELIVDFLCLPADSIGYPVMAAHPGGAPANFLAALAACGAKTALMAKVGADAFGRMLTDAVTAAGIDPRGIVSAEDVFTTLAFVTLDSWGEREFSFARKPGADTCLRFEELELSMLEQAKVFHFGTLSLTDEPARSTTRRALEYARSCGCLISCDPNYRPPLWKSAAEAAERMRWAVEQADVVKLSDGEAEFLFGLNPADAADYVVEHCGVKLAFVTCGARGCVFRNRNAAGFAPALKGLTAADTTGAGDIFGGCAMWKLLQYGLPPEKLDGAQLREIAAFANAAAGLSVTKAGGITSVPTPEEIAAQLATGQR